MVNYDACLEAMPEGNLYAPPPHQQLPPTAAPTQPPPAPAAPSTPVVQEIDMEISDGKDMDELPQPKALPVALASGM